MKTWRCLRVVLGGIIALAVEATAWAQTPYYLSVHTHTKNDTLVVGVLSTLHFTVDSGGAGPIAAFTWPIRFSFSNGNIMGPVSASGPNANVGYVPWSAGPDSTLFSSPTGGADPDTVLVRFVDTLAPGWTGSGEQWRIAFVPSDTGLITVDTATISPGHTLQALDLNALPHPVVWQARTITVAPFCPSGDLNGDGVLNDADLYILVRYIQFGGPPPAVCLAHADVNCSGAIESGDIIQEIHYIYHGDKTLCYTCNLITQGVWVCP